MRKIGICKSCGKEETLYAFDLCRGCYNHKDHKRRIEKDKSFNVKGYNSRKDKSNYKEKHRKAVNSWSKRNPEKKNAQLIAQKSIKIKEGTICSMCNHNLATQRHHSDYSKPQDVELLCNKCHKDLHNKSKDTKTNNLNNTSTNLNLNKGCGKQIDALGYIICGERDDLKHGCQMWLCDNCKKAVKNES